MLYKHSLDTGRAKITVANIKIPDLQVAAEFRVRVIGLVEIPGFGIATTPETVGSNFARLGPLDCSHLHHKVSTAINVEKYRLKLVTNRQLECKIAHPNS